MLVRFRCVLQTRRARSQLPVIATLMRSPDDRPGPLITGMIGDVRADDNNATPLYFAAERCTWTEIVQSLLKHGAKTTPKTRGGSTALQSAEWAKCTENAKLISGK
jgi:hypothetical protein